MFRFFSDNTIAWMKNDILFKIQTGVFGGLLLACIALLSKFFDQPLIIGSFGASIFLLLVAPASPFSHPKNLILGHLVTTLLSFLCFLCLGDSFWSLPASMGASIVAMQLLNISHPPAAANPIIVQLAMPDHSLFLIPILIGPLLLCISAMAFHKMLTGCKYPTSN